MDMQAILNEASKSVAEHLVRVEMWDDRWTVFICREATPIRGTKEQLDEFAAIKRREIERLIDSVYGNVTPPSGIAALALAAGKVKG